MSEPVMYEQKPPQVYGAISEVMAALATEGVSKARKNSQQGYMFRGVDDMYNALCRHLSRAKLAILPRVLNRTVTERETKNGGVLFYVVLDVEFDFVSGVDGSKHVVRVIGEAMDSGDKATNKAMSAAYKYACMEVFCIPTEGDNDADANTHEPTAKPGVTIVNPRGDESQRPPKNQQLVDSWVTKIADTLAASEASRHAALVYTFHSELCADEYLYIDVADALASGGIVSKGKWKEFVRAGNPKRAAA